MKQAWKGTPELFADVNCVEICYQTMGGDDAPAMLMIMDLGRQMVGCDDEFCVDLADRGYRIVRFDNRDSGRSSKFPSANARSAAAAYLLKDMATDAIGLLDALGIARAHVVGASMGGMIAQEMAIHWPQRVRSLTSIMSTTSEPGLTGPTDAALAVLRTPPAAAPEDYIEAFCRDAIVLRGFGFPRDETRDRARAARHVVRGLCPDGIGRQILAVAASGSRKSGLAGLRMPALVIHGADDPLVPLAAGEATAEAIPDARLVVVEHMGHSLPIETWLHMIDAIDDTAKAA